TRRPPSSTLFPYTTLFRSLRHSTLLLERCGRDGSTTSSTSPANLWLHGSTRLSTIFSEACAGPSRSAASNRSGSSASSGIRVPTHCATSWSVVRSPLDFTIASPKKGGASSPRLAWTDHVYLCFAFTTALCSSTQATSRLRRR